MSIRHRLLLACSLILLASLLLVAVPSCNIFDQLGNAECAAAGNGGDDGEGGEGGAGGAPDEGAGGAVAASSTAGVGGAPGAGVGVGAGDSSAVGAGAGSGRSVPPSARPHHGRRHHKGGENIGTAVSADCPAPVPSAQQCPQVNNDYVFCAGSVISFFRMTNFSFVTTVADDGEGPAGGYQESNTYLTLADGVLDGL